MANETNNNKQSKTGFIHESYLAQYKNDRDRKEAEKRQNEFHQSVNTLVTLLQEERMDRMRGNKDNVFGRPSSNYGSASSFGRDIDTQLGASLTESAVQMRASAERMDRSAAQFENIANQYDMTTRSMVSGIKRMSADLGSSIQRAARFTARQGGRVIGSGTRALASSRQVEMFENTIGETKDAFKTQLINLMFGLNPVTAFFGAGALNTGIKAARAGRDKISDMRQRRQYRRQSGGYDDYDYEDTQVFHKGGVVVAHQGALIQRAGSSTPRKLSPDERITVLKEGETVLPTHENAFMKKFTRAIADAIVDAETQKLKFATGQRADGDFKTHPTTMKHGDDQFARLEEALERVRMQSEVGAFGDEGLLGGVRPKVTQIMAHSVPIFGSHYKSELPNIRKMGVTAGIFRVLSTMYVHDRFAAEEQSRLMLQQTKLLAAGLGVEGNISDTKARTISQAIGRTVGKAAGVSSIGRHGAFRAAPGGGGGGRGTGISATGYTFYDGLVNDLNRVFFGGFTGGGVLRAPPRPKQDHDPVLYKTFRKALLSVGGGAGGGGGGGGGGATTSVRRGGGNQTLFGKAFDSLFPGGPIRGMGDIVRNRGVDQRIAFLSRMYPGYIDNRSLPEMFYHRILRRSDKDIQDKFGEFTWGERAKAGKKNIVDRLTGAESKHNRRRTVKIMKLRGKDSRNKNINKILSSLRPLIESYAHTDKVDGVNTGFEWVSTEVDRQITEKKLDGRLGTLLRNKAFEEYNKKYYSIDEGTIKAEIMGDPLSDHKVKVRAQAGQMGLGTLADVTTVVNSPEFESARKSVVKQANKDLDVNKGPQPITEAISIIDGMYSPGSAARGVPEPLSSHVKQRLIGQLQLIYDSEYSTPTATARQSDEFLISDKLIKKDAYRKSKLKVNTSRTRGLSAGLSDLDVRKNIERFTDSEVEGIVRKHSIDIEAEAFSDAHTGDHLGLEFLRTLAKDESDEYYLHQGIIGTESIILKAMYEKYMEVYQKERDNIIDANWTLGSPSTHTMAGDLHTILMADRRATQHGGRTGVDFRRYITLASDAGIEDGKAGGGSEAWDRDITPILPLIRSGTIAGVTELGLSEVYAESKRKITEDVLGKNKTRSLHETQAREREEAEQKKLDKIYASKYKKYEEHKPEKKKKGPIDIERSPLRELVNLNKSIASGISSLRSDSKFTLGLKKKEEKDSIWTKLFKPKAKAGKRDIGQILDKLSFSMAGGIILPLLTTALFGKAENVLKAGKGVLIGSIAGALLGMPAGLPGIMLGVSAGGLIGGMIGGFAPAKLDQFIDLIKERDHRSGKFYGAVIGGLFGLMIGGPFGMSLGIAAGSFIGRHVSSKVKEMGEDSAFKKYLDEMGVSTLFKSENRKMTGRGMLIGSMLGMLFMGPTGALFGGTAGAFLSGVYRRIASGGDDAFAKTMRRYYSDYIEGRSIPIATGAGIGGILGLIISGGNPMVAAATASAGAFIAGRFGKMLDVVGKDGITKTFADLLFEHKGEAAVGAGIGGIIGLLATGFNPLFGGLGATVGAMWASRSKETNRSSITDYIKQAFGNLMEYPEEAAGGAVLGAILGTIVGSTIGIPLTMPGMALGAFFAMGGGGKDGPSGALGLLSSMAATAGKNIFKSPETMLPITIGGALVGGILGGMVGLGPFGIKVGAALGAGLGAMIGNKVVDIDNDLDKEFASGTGAVQDARNRGSVLGGIAGAVLGLAFGSKLGVGGAIGGASMGWSIGSKVGEAIFGSVENMLPANIQGGLLGHALQGTAGAGIGAAVGAIAGFILLGGPGGAAVGAKIGGMLFGGIAGILSALDAGKRSSDELEKMREVKEQTQKQISNRSESVVNKARKDVMNKRSDGFSEEVEKSVVESESFKKGSKSMEGIASALLGDLDYMMESGEERDRKFEAFANKRYGKKTNWGDAGPQNLLRLSAEQFKDDPGKMDTVQFDTPWKDELVFGDFYSTQDNPSDIIERMGILGRFINKNAEKGNILNVGELKDYLFGTMESIYGKTYKISPYTANVHKQSLAEHIDDLTSILGLYNIDDGEILFGAADILYKYSNSKADFIRRLFTPIFESMQFSNFIPASAFKHLHVRDKKSEEGKQAIEELKNRTEQIADEYGKLHLKRIKIKDKIGIPDPSAIPEGYEPINFEKRYGKKLINRLRGDMAEGSRIKTDKRGNIAPIFLANNNKDFQQNIKSNTITTRLAYEYETNPLFEEDRKKINFDNISGQELYDLTKVRYGDLLEEKEKKQKNKESTDEIDLKIKDAEESLGRLGKMPGVITEEHIKSADTSEETKPLEGFAKGGKTKDKYYIAGEKGPELIVNPEESTHRILSATDTKSVARELHRMTGVGGPDEDPKDVNQSEMGSNKFLKVLYEQDELEIINEQRRLEGLPLIDRSDTEAAANAIAIYRKHREKAQEELTAVTETYVEDVSESLFDKSLDFTKGLFSRGSQSEGQQKQKSKGILEAGLMAGLSGLWKLMKFFMPGLEDDRVESIIDEYYGLSSSFDTPYTTSGLYGGMSGDASHQRKMLSILDGAKLDKSYYDLMEITKGKKPGSPEWWLSVVPWMKDNSILPVKSVNPDEVNEQMSGWLLKKYKTQSENSSNKSVLDVIENQFRDQTIELINKENIATIGGLNIIDTFDKKYEDKNLDWSDLYSNMYTTSMMIQDETGHSIGDLKDVYPQILDELIFHNFDPSRLLPYIGQEMESLFASTTDGPIKPDAPIIEENAWYKSKERDEYMEQMGLGWLDDYLDDGEGGSILDKIETTSLNKIMSEIKDAESDMGFLTNMNKILLDEIDPTLHKNQIKGVSPYVELALISALMLDPKYKAGASLGEDFWKNYGENRIVSTRMFFEDRHEAYKKEQLFNMLQLITSEDAIPANDEEVIMALLSNIYNKEIESIEALAYSGMSGGTWPPVSGTINSLFGPRKDPLGKTNEIRDHKGIDFGAPMGTPVHSVLDGTVEYAQWVGGGGKAIGVRHSNGLLTEYMHLSDYKVNVGERVKAGDIIALSGNTGSKTTGPHLHFGVKVNDIHQDPQKIFGNLPPLKSFVEAGSLSISMGSVGIPTNIRDDDKKGIGKLIAKSGVVPYVNEAAKKYGVDPALIYSMIWQESTFRPNLTSSAGAKGFMQLMPGTASDLGVTDVWDPRQNIEGGTSYIRKMMDMFNKDNTIQGLKYSLAAYNWGPGNMQKFLKGEKTQMPMETQNYMRMIHDEKLPHIRSLLEYSAPENAAAPENVGSVQDGIGGPEIPVDKLVSMDAERFILGGKASSSSTNAYLSGIGRKIGESALAISENVSNAVNYAITTISSSNTSSPTTVISSGGGGGGDGGGYSAGEERLIAMLMNGYDTLDFG